MEIPEKISAAFIFDLFDTNPISYDNECKILECYIHYIVYRLEFMYTYAIESHNLDNLKDVLSVAEITDAEIIRVSSVVGHEFISYRAKIGIIISNIRLAMEEKDPTASKYINTETMKDTVSSLINSQIIKTTLDNDNFKKLFEIAKDTYHDFEFMLSNGDNISFQEFIDVKLKACEDILYYRII